MIQDLEKSSTKPTADEPLPDKTRWLEMFRGKFRAFLAFWVVTLSIGYMYAATFIPWASEAKHTGTILGFLTGTAVALVLSFYYSGSEGADTSGMQDEIKELKRKLAEAEKRA